MKKLNQKGFSHLEIILIVVVLAMVGGSGFYIFRQNNRHKVSLTNQSNVASTNTAKQAATTTVSDPYADWKTGKLQYEKITYKYPANWTIDDQSTASSKSDNACVYPGHDLVKLISPRGNKMDFNAGQACFGYSGDKNFGSTPVKALGQDMYIGILGYDDGSLSTNKPDSACLIPAADQTGRFFPSKNIFFVTGDKPTSDMFCYVPKGSFATAEDIKSTADYTTAVLILESMKY